MSISLPKTKHHSLCIWLLTTCIALHCGLSRADTSTFESLQLATEDYAPMNYFEAGQFKGISIDLLHEVWKLEGLDAKPEILMYPWARAYKELQRQKNFLLFAVARTPHRESLFQWACPIIKTRYILLGLKSANIQIDEARDILKYRVGTIRADVSEQELIENLPGAQRIIVSNTSMRPNLDLLDKGRIQLIAYDELGAATMLSNADRSIHDFQKAFTISQSQTCFAFNPSTDRSTVKRFQEHLSTLQQNGKYQEIVQRYYSPSHLRVRN